MKSARELSIMVLAIPPESGRILSIRMSRFSGYRSGASTTGQRSWGKSKGKSNKGKKRQNPHTTSRMQVTIQSNLAAVLEFPCCCRNRDSTSTAFFHPTSQFSTATWIFLENMNVE